MRESQRPAIPPTQTLRRYVACLDRPRPKVIVGITVDLMGELATRRSVARLPAGRSGPPELTLAHGRITKSWPEACDNQHSAVSLPEE